MKTLKDAASKRNELVHTQRQVISDSMIQRVLTAVTDMLWLYDYYQGFAWAKDHLRRSTREYLEHA